MIHIDFVNSCDIYPSIPDQAEPMIPNDTDPPRQRFVINESNALVLVFGVQFSSH